MCKKKIQEIQVWNLKTCLDVENIGLEEENIGLEKEVEQEWELGSSLLGDKVKNNCLLKSNLPNAFSDFSIV